MPELAWIYWPLFIKLVQTSTDLSTKNTVQINPPCFTKLSYGIKTSNELSKTDVSV